MSNIANNGSKWITIKKRQAIYERDFSTCVYCGDYLLEKQLSLDHVKPQALGGSNAAANLVTCCRECNRRKSYHNLPAFLYFLITKHNIGTAAIAKRVRKQVNTKLIGAKCRVKNKTVKK